jgi:DUF1680 family protein
LGSIPEYIYSICQDGIYVDLFAPSSISWTLPEGEITLTQFTEFPFSSEVRLRLKLAIPADFKINIRTPGWCTKGMPIRVNGNVVATGQPGTYAHLDKPWDSGDVIDFVLPMDFRLTKYAGVDKINGQDRYALEYGPILLAVSGADDAALKVQNGHRPEDIVKQLRANPETPLRFEINGHPNLTYIPYWKVLNEPFTCFPVIKSS